MRRHPDEHLWLRRHRRWLAAAGALLGMSGAVFGLLTAHNWSTAYFLVFMCLAPMYFLPYAIGSYRIHYRYHLNDGKLCGNCLFPLEGLDAEGDCPECGTPYSIEETVSRWRRDLQIKPEKE